MTARVALAGLLCVTSCHAARPLDGEAMLREFRQAATAQRASPASTMDEDAAVRLAVAGSPSVQTARAMVAEALGGEVRVRSVDNPEVRVDNAYLRRGSNNLDRDVYKLGLDLRVNLPSLAELPARIDAARADVTAARAGVGIEETRVRMDVRVAFARAAAARGKSALLSRLLAARREREANVALSVSGGHAVASDLSLARVAVVDALDRAGRAALDGASARGALGRVLATEPPGPDSLVLPEGPSCRAAPGDVAALEDRALAGSPDLDRRRALHLRAQEEARAENLAWLPRLKFLEVGYSRNFLAGTEPVDATNQVEPRYYAWGVHVGVGLDLPLWNWNQGRVAAAEARVDGEAARFREALAGTVADLHRSLARWREAHERAQRTGSTTLPAAEEALKLTRQAVESGRLPVTAALEAEERLLLARIGLIDDLMDCRVGEVEVEAALGRDL